MKKDYILIKNKIDAELEKVCSFKSEFLNRTVSYSLDRGGKRLRPLLLIEACRSFSGSIENTLNASIAMTILTRTKRTKRPKIKIADLNLPDWMSWFFVIAAIIALLGGGEMKFLGQNLALILATPFFFLGLAVVHNLARYVALPGLLLTSFYLVLILSGWIALAVMAAGIIEQWIGLRRYFGPKKTET